MRYLTQRAVYIDYWAMAIYCFALLWK